ncbi:MAG TPA: DUF2877 domain-containing protein [Anaerolineales bacterium]|nr:DUF2877 domain-containing protein [Anaerolineales bacterium]HRQ92982.1 DUF2877 domain-containing protein [Anaerolineales bacterium]
MSSNPRLRALSIAPAAQHWLNSTQEARVLYSFEAVVNLVNQDAHVLSLVDERIGNGPFSIVLEEFPSGVHAESRLLVFENGLWLDDWLIDADEAPLWQPIPDWASLHAAPGLVQHAAGDISALLATHAPADSLARLVLAAAGASTLPARIQQLAEQNIPLLLAGVQAHDNAKMTEAARKLAGIGPGLTPAGDDLLLGAMYGLWATQPPASALQSAETIATVAIERTHALSAAWLAAGSRGEAAAPWHQLVAAIGTGDSAAVQSAALRILPTGHTSGADALAGFMAVLQGSGA